MDMLFEVNGTKHTKYDTCIKACFSLSLSQLVEKLLLSFMFGHSEDDVAQNI